MGRKGTAGAGIARARTLPEGVTELGEHYSFEGIKVSKKMLSELDGEIISNNPFDIEFPTDFVGIWGYDSATKELIVAPLVDTHATIIKRAGRAADEDRFVKGGYDAEAKKLTLYTDRHIARNRRDEWGAWNMQFDAVQMLKRFFPGDTKIEVDTYGNIETTRRARTQYLREI